MLLPSKTSILCMIPVLLLFQAICDCKHLSPEIQHQLQCKFQDLQSKLALESLQAKVRNRVVEKGSPGPTHGGSSGLKLGACLVVVSPQSLGKGSNLDAHFLADGLKKTNYINNFLMPFSIEK